jgi:drug/metabolite transporter (DMT)-like permease
MLQLSVLLLISCIWGASWLFLKVGLRDVQPFTLAWMRFAIAIPVLALIVWRQGAPLPRARRDWAWLALAGFIGFTLNYTLVFWGAQFIPSGLASVLQATIPAFGLLLGAWLLPGERLTARMVVSVAVGIAGVMVIFADQLRVASAAALAGCIALAVTAVLNGLNGVIVRRNLRHVHPMSTTLCQLLASTPLLFALALAVEGLPTRFNWSPASIGALLYLTIGGSIIAFIGYYWLLRHWETGKAMLYALIMPVVSVTLGWLVLGEQLQPQSLLGGALVLCSVVMSVIGVRSVGSFNDTNDTADTADTNRQDAKAA